MFVRSNSPESVKSPVELFSELEHRNVPECLRAGGPIRASSTTADHLSLPHIMDGQGPLVSVIIPTFGDAEFVPDALESVGAQTYRPLEVIIVDSSEVEWLKELPCQRPWVKYIPQTEPGLSLARNEGIKASRGELIAFLDADDIWHPEKLTTQVSAHIDDVAISFTAMHRVNTTGGRQQTYRVIDRRMPSGDPPWRVRLRGNVGALPSSIAIRADDLPDRPFPEEINAGEDMAFAVEHFYHHPPRHIPEPLAIYRDRPGSLSDNSHLMHREMIGVIEYLLKQLPQERAALTERLGKAKAAYAQWLSTNDRSDENTALLIESRLLKGRAALARGDLEKATLRFYQALQSAPESRHLEIYLEIVAAWQEADAEEPAREYLDQLRTSVDGLAARIENATG